ncbi:MAG: glycoside hydrolase family 5 protein [Fimbriiglobus sp.]
MRRLLPALAALLGISCSPAPADDDPAAAAVAALGPGVNLGNALDAPNEGDWGFRIKAEYFGVLKAAGFGHVRLPVRWSAHADKDAPYTIHPKFFTRVDEVLKQATDSGLRVVLNVHHYDEIFADPAGHRARWLGLWKQIAARYADRPDTVLFEPLNEPHDKLTPALWNDFFAAVLPVIRAKNPTRIVVVGPGQWNGIYSLKDLKLPETDRRLVVTVHYYEPFKFTHQGATWVKGADEWLGTAWTGTADERQKVRDDFAVAAAWAKGRRRPVYLGEFGAFEKADMDSRARWTAFVRAEAARRGWGWAYWEFGSTFGCYDPEKNQWREPLLKALIPGGK